MQAGVEKSQGPLTRAQAAIWASVLSVSMGASGCGGGAGSNVTSPEDSTASGGGAGGGSGGTGGVRVKVTDVFGDPVAGASVSWLPGSGTPNGKMTDSQGVVQFDALQGEGRLCADHPVRGYSCGESADEGISIKQGRVIEVSRQLRPHFQPEATVLSAMMGPDGVSADGKSIELTLRVAVSAPLVDGSWFVYGEEWGYNGLYAAGCTARTGDELSERGPLCVSGLDRSDTSYSFGQVTHVGVAHWVERPSVPTAVGLLIDQSDAGFSPDWLPNDSRLFAAKLLTDRLLPGTPVLLGAFASDDASGAASGLLQRPLTLFPVENPGYMTSRTEAFRVLNDLQELVGGGAPLYEAIAAGVDFMSARTPPEVRRVLVVLAEGPDTACVTAAQCAALRRDIVERLHDAAVELLIVSVGRDYEWCLPGTCDSISQVGEGVSALAREAGIPVIVAPEDGTGLASPMELIGQWLAGSMMVQEISLRLTSETAGAFAPGSTVMGSMTGANPSECPMGCRSHQFFFSVEVPR